MNANLRIVILFLFALFASCNKRSALPEDQPRTTNKDDLAELRQVVAADPVKDFEIAKDRKDIHFIGIAGIGLLVPGVDGSVYQDRAPVHVIKGTGDLGTSNDQGPLTLTAIDYARRYNELVIAFLREEDQKAGRMGPN